MSNLHQHNLNRDIPEEVKREVRQRTGYGCVICGRAFYQYEHFDPEYKDAKKHDPNGITLLCANHHDDKTRKRLSKETIVKANSNPFCLKDGFSHGPLELNSNPFKIQIGNTLFINPKSILTIEGESILKIAPPEKGSMPFSLTFIPSDNEKSSKIIDNEWFGDIGEWDIETIGNKIIVREKKGKIILEIENDLNGCLIFHKLDITFKGIKVETRNIPAKKIGPHNIAEQKITRIINTEEREIARFGSMTSSNNQMEWTNALEVMNDYMNPNLSGMTLTNGDFYYIHNSANPIMSHCNIKAATLNVGIAHEHFEFSKFVGTMNQKNPTKKDKIKFSNTIKYFRHTKLIEQLPKEEITILKNIEKRCRL